MSLSGKKLKRELLRLKETGKVDKAIGAKDIGLVIDLHNQTIEKTKEKHFNKEIRDRNLYYWRLWVKASRDLKAGIKPKKSGKQ